MITFDVTYTRVNEREAEQGGTDRHGMEDTGLRLWEAIKAAHNVASHASEACGTYASGSDPRAARWMTCESLEWETGDSVEASIHFPANTTPASRARLVRVLTGRL
jgi:hypothetical protein